MQYVTLEQFTQLDLKVFERVFFCMKWFEALMEVLFISVSLARGAL